MVRMIVASMILVGSLVALIVKIIFTVRKSKENQKETSANESQHDKSILDKLPVSTYDQEHDVFVMRDGSCLDLIEVISSDLANESEDAILVKKLRLTKLYKLYPDDLKIVTINLPSNTTEQQNFIRKKMESTRNELHRKYLRAKEKELIWIENNRTNREFYFMYFGNDVGQIVERRDIITSSLGTGKQGMAQIINQEKKTMVLHLMLNKCEYILED